MNAIVADENQKKQLSGMDKAVPIRDESGQVLARAVTESNFQDLLYSWVHSEILNAELPKYDQDERRKVLDGIMARVTLFVKPVPEPLKTRLRYLWAKNIVTDEELDAISSEEGEQTLSEILDELQHT